MESSAPASDAGGGNYAVRVLDNPRNTYEEVIHICMLALDCSVEAAYAIALEIDHQGSAVVLEADRKTAEQVAEIIGTIGIEVKVEPLGAQ